MNLLQLWEEISTKTTVEQLCDLMQRIDAQLITKKKEDLGNAEFLLLMKNWKDINVAGRENSRQERLPDGAKLWLKMYLTDLSVLIRSFQIASDCSRQSASVLVSNPPAMQTTIVDLQSTMAKLMPTVRPASARLASSDKSRTLQPYTWIFTFLWIFTFR